MSFPWKRNAFTLVVMCSTLALSAVASDRKISSHHNTTRYYAAAHLASSLPLFVTFDGGLNPSKIAAAASTVAPRETFVWGASPGNLRAWQAAAPHASLSYYMPYSRAPAASMGFDLAFFQAHHPDWVLYGCDRTTVAFWDGQTAKSGSPPSQMLSTARGGVFLEIAFRFPLRPLVFLCVSQVILRCSFGVSLVSLSISPPWPSDQILCAA